MRGAVRQRRVLGAWLSAGERDLVKSHRRDAETMMNTEACEAQTWTPIIVT